MKNCIIYYSTKTKDTVIIRLNFWNSTLLEFPGKSAKKFYKYIKLKKVNWEIFKPNSVTRIDICFDLPQKDSFDIKKFDRFLISSRDYVQYNTRTANLKLINDSSKGRILGINRRSNPRYFRVYEKVTTKVIRFEYELKKTAVRIVQQYLLDLQFDLFENELTNLYFHYAKKLFPLDNEFVDWLLDFNRKDQVIKNYSPELVLAGYTEFSDHLIELEKPKAIFHRLQFLNFIKTLDEQHWIPVMFDDATYYKQNFYLYEFLKFLKIPLDQHTRRNEIIEFFLNLQTMQPVLEQDPNGSFMFRSSIGYCGIVPELNTRRWVVRISIHEDLFYHQYPFFFINSFRTYKNETDCLLKVYLIRILCIDNPKKIFYLLQFLEQLSSLSNARIRQVKHDFILLVKELINEKIIQNKIIFVYQNSNRPNDELDQSQLKLNKINKRVKYLLFYEQIITK